MSTKSNAIKPREVTDPASLAIETAAMDGGITEGDLEARYILDENPHRQTSFEELRDEMIRWGRACVGGEFGERSVNSPDGDPERFLARETTRLSGQQIWRGDQA